MKVPQRRLRRWVLPVRTPQGTIGTATMVAPGRALTALHVITTDDPEKLRLGAGLAVRDVETLPVAAYRAARWPALRSKERAEWLVGGDFEAAQGTVDLALLEVPGLRGAAPRLRFAPVKPGEQMLVPGYPGGDWSISQGPVTAADDADFAVQMLLGPGASGAPALDRNNRLAGVVTLDHESATICIGPELLTVFLHQLLT